MKEEFFQPPGIVQKAETLQEFLAEAGRLHEEVEQGDRANMERWFKIGRALNRARELFGQGDWGAELQRLGISRQRASEAMTAAKCPGGPDISTCRSWNDVLRVLASIKKGSGKVVKKKAPRKKKKPQPCDRCLRIGGPACPACWEAFPEGFPERQPGEDDPEEEPADTMEEGRIIYDIKKVEKNAFAPARREITKFTKLYGLSEESPELKRLRDAHAAYKQAWLDAIKAVSWR